MKEPIGRKRIVKSLTDIVHNAVKGNSELLIETLHTPALLEHFLDMDPAIRKNEISLAYRSIASNYYPLAMKAIVQAGERFAYTDVLKNIKPTQQSTGFTNTLSKIKQADKDGVIIFILNHQTNLDSMIDAYSFYRHISKDLHFQFCAGKKIGKGAAKYMLPLLGAWFVSKGEGDWKIGLDQMYMAGSLALGVNTALYTQGTRPKSGKFKFSPQLGIMDAAIALEKQNIEGVPPIYIVKVTKSYSFIPEDNEFYDCYMNGKKMPSADLMSDFGRLAGVFKTVSDSAPTIEWHMHDPVPLGEYISGYEGPAKREGWTINKKILREIADARNIPPIAMVNTAMHELHKTKKSFTINDLANKTKEHANATLGYNSLQHNKSNVTQLIREYFEKRKIVTSNEGRYNITKNGLNSVLFTTNLYKDLYPAFIQDKL